MGIIRFRNAVLRSDPVSANANFYRDTPGTHHALNGDMHHFVAHEPRITDAGWLLEGVTRRNLNAYSDASNSTSKLGDEAYNPSALTYTDLGSGTESGMPYRVVKIEGPLTSGQEYFGVWLSDLMIAVTESYFRVVSRQVLPRNAR